MAVKASGRRVTKEWESAVRNGDLADLQRQITAGADVNARDRYGQTGLMLAAQAGHTEIVDALIAANADLNQTAKFTLTALMLAILAGRQEAARRLVEAGADVRVKGTGAPGFFGKTALDLATERGYSDLAERMRD
jgi:ankyrin repeat protein